MALAQNDGSIVHSYFLSRMLFTPEQVGELLPLTKKPPNSSEAKESLVESLNSARKLDPVNRISYLESRCYMLNTLLRDSDVMSMAHGLEVRVPLIDHQLARAVLRLPGAWKLDAGTPKPLLVRALEGKLPEKIVRRKKRGFTLPFEHWMRDSLRPAVEESIGKIADGALNGLVDPAAARHVWDDFLQGRTSWSRPWSLYVLQCWCERHFSN